LPYLGIVEHISSTNMPIRLAGSGLEDLFGVPLTGVNTFDINTPESGRSIAKLYEIIYNQGCVVVGHRIFVSGAGQNFNCEVTILPLHGEKEENPQYFVWYNTQKIERFDLGVARFIAHNYHQLELLDMGNGVPDINVNLFEFILHIPS